MPSFVVMEAPARPLGMVEIAIPCQAGMLSFAFMKTGSRCHHLSS